MKRCQESSPEKRHALSVRRSLLPAPSSFFHLERRHGSMCCLSAEPPSFSNASSLPRSPSLSSHPSFFPRFLFFIFLPPFLFHFFFLFFFPLLHTCKISKESFFFFIFSPPFLHHFFFLFLSPLPYTLVRSVTILGIKGDMKPGSVGTRL